MAATSKSRVPLFALIGVVVLALVVVIIVVSSNDDSSSTAPTTVGVATTATIVTKATSVPASAFDRAGLGAVNLNGTLTKLGAPAAGTKPDVLYLGAEFCPYCAAERWAIVASLSRFGSFSGLSLINSSENNLPTFTFKGSSFTSDYLTFTPVETKDQQRNDLEPVSAAQQARWKVVADKLTSGSLSFPTVDFAGVYGMAGSSYNPATLSKQSHNDIATNLSDPSTPVAQAILGASNVFSAMVCATTANQPAAVCESAGVKLAAAALPAA